MGNSDTKSLTKANFDQQNPTHFDWYANEEGRYDKRRAYYFGCLGSRDEVLKLMEVLIPHTRQRRNKPLIKLYKETGGEKSLPYCRWLFELGEANDHPTSDHFRDTKSLTLCNQILYVISDGVENKPCREKIEKFLDLVRLFGIERVNVTHTSYTPQEEHWFVEYNSILKKVDEHLSVGLIWFLPPFLPPTEEKQQLENEEKKLNSTEEKEQEEKKNGKPKEEKEQEEKKDGKPKSNSKQRCRYSTIEMKLWNVKDVLEWLQDFGFNNYIQNFQENMIDGQMFHQFTDQEFKDIGMTNKFHIQKLINNRNTRLEQESKKKAEKKTEIYRRVFNTN